MSASPTPFQPSGIGGIDNEDVAPHTAPGSPTDVDDAQFEKMLRSVRRRERCGCAALALGVLFIVTGVALLAALTPMIGFVVHGAVTVAGPRSLLYPAFLNPENDGIYTYRKYTWFNITNPYEVANGSKPIITEVGPFVYREVDAKDPHSVRWFLNGSVGYKYTTRLIFEPAMSVDALTDRQLSENETLVVLNPPLKGLTYRIGRLPKRFEALGIHDVPGRFFGCAAANYTALLGAQGGFDLPLNISHLLHLLYDDVALPDIDPGTVRKLIVGPYGIFTPRTNYELLWGYTDPIWRDVHPVISILGYSAATYYQTQWNDTNVVPSPYTYRSGQKCPLWNDLGDCNSTVNDFTMEESGRTGGIVPPAQAAQGPDDWLPGHPAPAGDTTHRETVTGPVVPSGDYLRPGLGASPANHGDMTQYAGQRLNWWWGPAVDGLTSGTGASPLRHGFHALSEEADPLRRAVRLVLHGRGDELPAAEEQRATQHIQAMSEAKLVGRDDLDVKSAWTSLLKSPSQPEEEASPAMRGFEATSSNHSDGEPPVPPNLCRRVHGTTGMRFPPGMTPASQPSLFIGMIGRSFAFSHVGETEVKGIEAMRFHMADEGLVPSAANRYCFQIRFKGFFNLSQQAFGPGIVSKAMFLDTCFQDAAANDSSAITDDTVFRCVDPMMPDEDVNGTAPSTDDGFISKHLVLNVSFALPPNASLMWRAIHHSHIGRPTERATAVGTSTDAAAPLSDAALVDDDDVAAAHTAPMGIDQYAQLRTGGGFTSDAFRGEFDSHIDVQQLTGMALRGNAHGQINLAMGPTTAVGCDNMFPWARNLPTTVLPFIRAQRTATLSTTWADRLKKDLRLITAAKVVLSLTIVGGVALIVAALALRLNMVPAVISRNLPTALSDATGIDGSVAGSAAPTAALLAAPRAQRYGTASFAGDDNRSMSTMAPAAGNSSVKTRDS